MTEQIGTPGSNADTSVNGAKVSAPKDKSCPFCHQPFTSSSLGRHLDLYIKEKNPKPADGVHNVDEIRKMRGGITRRQPRNSAARREVSTPGETPGGRERSPLDSAERGKRSPSLRVGSSVGELDSYCGKRGYAINRPSWEATGVINHIPSTRSDGTGRGWEIEEREGGRKMDSRNRSVSRHMLAKSTFEQKEKMVDALDNARAAELALRELLGSLRAAKQRIDGRAIFDYDPLTLDFPSLTLKCLPPPPTLHQTNPFPSSSSWSILPPDEEQYQALRAHFSEEFRRWRVACTIATTTPNDDLSYPPLPFAANEDPAEVARRAEEDSRELENQISEHLHSVFTRWTALTPQSRAEFWTLALARDIGSKSAEISKLKKDKDYSQQEISHLKLQVDELSRLQHPREFRLSRPETIPFDSKIISMLGEKTIMERVYVGWNIMDRNIHIDAVVERAIGRWKNVVKEARNGRPGSAGKLSGQLSLTGEPILAHSPVQQKPVSVDHGTNLNGANQGGVQMTNDPDAIGNDPDADADADADMEEDDFVEMSDAPLASGQGGPDGTLAQAANFRLANGYGSSTPHQQQQGTNGRRGPVMEGIENQTCVGGYVRIGA